MGAIDVVDVRSLGFPSYSYLSLSGLGYFRSNMKTSNVGPSCPFYLRSCLFYLSFNFDFYVPKIMHL